MASYTAGAPTPDRKQTVPSGTYDAEIKDATEKTASTGSDMIELKLEIMLPGGGEELGPIVYDNLVFTEKSGWKIDNFRAAIGETVTPGEVCEILPDDLIGKTLKVRLSSENWRGKDGSQPPKLRNTVAGFVIPKPGEAPPAARPKATTTGAPPPAKDDNIPF